MIGETGGNEENRYRKSKMKTQSTALQLYPSTEPGTKTLDESNVVTDATKQEQACISMPQIENSDMCAAESPVQTSKSYLITAVKSQIQQEAQELTSSPSDHSSNMNRNPQSSNTEPLQENSPSSSDIEKEVLSAHLEEFSLSTCENVSTLPVAQSQTFRVNANAHEQAKLGEDTSVTPRKVFTIVLDMQRNENVAPDVLGRTQEPETSDKRLSKYSNMESLGKKSRLLSALRHPESDKTSFKPLNSAQSDMSGVVAGAQEQKSCEDSGARPKKVLTIVLELQPQDMKLGDQVDSPRGSEEVEPTKNCQLDDAAETFPDVDQKEVAGCGQAFGQTTSSLFCTTEDSVQIGDILMKINVIDDLMGANAAQSAATGHAEMKKKDVNPESKHAKVPQRRGTDLMLREEGESELRSTLVLQRQVGSL